MRREIGKSIADEEEETEINLTPMLDVVFIMLIFFIVTASFVKESGLDVNKPPDSDVQEKEDDENILIVINANDDIYIDRRLIDTRAIRANIERKHAENPGRDRRCPGAQQLQQRDAGGCHGCLASGGCVQRVDRPGDRRLIHRSVWRRPHEACRPPSATFRKEYRVCLHDSAFPSCQGSRLRSA